MNLVLLNFVWSGVLIGESFIRFWYIIPATIVIEMVIIKLMTSHPWGNHYLSLQLETWFLELLRLLL